MKWIDAELKVFKQQYTELKERIARESTESAHAANVLEQSKAITLAVRPRSRPLTSLNPARVGPAHHPLPRVKRERMVCYHAPVLGATHA